MTFRTRFAPSPTGPLHLGHAYSALLAYDMSIAAGGAFLLRIEDIDQSRARAEWEAQIFDDLAWLGLKWPLPVMRQSERQCAYDAALDGLWQRGLLYPCRCTRRDIQEATSAPQEGAAIHGPDGLIYPGTCRPDRTVEPSIARPKDVTLRLNMARAIEHLGPEHPAKPLKFHETGQSRKDIISFDADDLIQNVGDIVLARKDMGTSYHLSVVLDDAAQEITHVVRGEDLFEATKIHVLLQALLNLPTPVYHHHCLIRDDAGKRLAKRDDARAISLYRNEGMSVDDIRLLLDT